MFQEEMFQEEMFRREEILGEGMFLKEEIISQDQGEAEAGLILDRWFELGPIFFIFSITTCDSQDALSRSECWSVSERPFARFD